MSIFAKPRLIQARRNLLLAPFLFTLVAASACDPGELRDLLTGRSHPGGTSDGGASDGGGTPKDPCAAAQCLAGTHCEAQIVECVKAPCPPVAVCVPNTPVFHCGGIAGIACPGSGKCVDDPADSCDPANGGADCGGICNCVETALCEKGAKFDSSPKVCACVPEPPVDNPCAAILCAANTHCEVKPVQCIKAPCPSVATCVPNTPVVRCGGFAGIACPGLGKCADDPADSCDPANGGADCGGICSCGEPVVCAKGAKFDSSPKVCACVSPPTCGPVCQIFCEYGNVLDANGCPTCKCNPPPTVSTCPAEKCTGPAPKSATYLCPDGKTTAGPACVVDAAGTCGWTITTCP
jgi:hypothetical protein